MSRSIASVIVAKVSVAGATQARPRVEEPVAQLALLVAREADHLGRLARRLLDQEQRLEDRVVQVRRDVGALLGAHALAALARQVAQRPEPPGREEHEEPGAHRHRAHEDPDGLAAKRADLREQGGPDEQERTSHAAAQRDVLQPVEVAALTSGAASRRSWRWARSSSEAPRQTHSAPTELSRSGQAKAPGPWRPIHCSVSSTANATVETARTIWSCAAVLDDAGGDRARLTGTGHERPEAHVGEEPEREGDHREDGEDAEETR